MRGDLRTDGTETAELSLWIPNLPAPRQKEKQVHKIQCTQVLAGLTVYSRAADKPRQNSFKKSELGLNCNQHKLLSCRGELIRGVGAPGEGLTLG